VKDSELIAAAAKIELAAKTLRATLASVDAQWTDAARRDFQENHLNAFEPNLRDILQAITRLAGQVAAAERQCE